MLEQQEVKVYKFSYLHSNHAVFKGEIKATSIENLHTQALSLLSQRFRRNLPLDGIHGKMVFTLVEESTV